jgi:hypothetical protein
VPLDCGGVYPIYLTTTATKYPALAGLARAPLTIAWMVFFIAINTSLKSLAFLIEKSFCGNAT